MKYERGGGGRERYKKVGEGAVWLNPATGEALLRRVKLSCFENPEHVFSLTITTNEHFVNRNHRERGFIMSMPADVRFGSRFQV